LNGVLFVSWYGHNFINVLSHNLVFCSDYDSIIVKFNNTINFNRNVVFNVDRFLLAYFNIKLDWLFDESVNNDWLNVLLFSWEKHWHLGFLRNWGELFIDNNFGLSVDFWLNDCDCLFDNFLNFNNFGLGYLFSDWHLYWNVDFFVLDHCISDLNWLFNKAVDNFGHFHNHQLLLLNFDKLDRFNNFLNDIVDQKLNWNLLVNSDKLFNWDLNNFLLLDHSLSDNWNLFDLLDWAVNF